MLVLAVLFSAGCRIPSNATRMSGRAADEWTRSYTLAEGGEVSINARNGTVDVEAADGTTVNVRAERIAHAVNDAAAAEILPRITIKEDVGPETVALRTEPLGGIVIGVTVEVNYHVRAPRSALVRLRSVNGSINVRGLGGRVILNGSNGGVTGEDLGGGVEARWANGPVKIALGSFKADLVDIRVTNGSLRLTLPDTANANLNASATNGTIDVSALQFERLGDQTARRVRGRLNAGGTPIELVVVNGNIVVDSGTSNVEPRTQNPELGGPNQAILAPNLEPRGQNAEPRTKNAEPRTKNAEPIKRP